MNIPNTNIEKITSNWAWHSHIAKSFTSNDYAERIYIHLDKGSMCYIKRLIPF